MKKHIVPIMNTILILLLVAGVLFLMYRVANRPETPVEATEATVSAATASDATVSTLPDVTYKVGIIQKANRPTAQKCYEGFISQLNTLGLLQNVEVIYVLEEDADECRGEIQRLIDEKCDLLYAIGTFAAKTAAELTSDIPIVFAGVSDPEEEGLVDSNTAPGGNVTGVSSFTPCFEQIDLIKILLPKAKTVGAIYCQTDTDAVMQAFIAESEAKSDDVKLKYEKYPVLSAKEIAGKLDDMKQDGVDVIYVPIDELVYDNFEVVAKFSRQNKIPIICGDEQALSEGGFATCLINHTSMGRKAGDLSYSILFEKKNPAELPVIYKYECFNYVNEEVMEKLGITLSDDALMMVEMQNYSAPDETE